MQSGQLPAWTPQVLCRPQYSLSGLKVYHWQSAISLQVFKQSELDNLTVEEICKLLIIIIRGPVAGRCNADDLSDALAGNVALLGYGNVRLCRRRVFKVILCSNLLLAMPASGTLAKLGEALKSTCCLLLPH